jgi:iron(III) transport system substrate-binding protein
LRLPGPTALLLGIALLCGCGGGDGGQQGEEGFDKVFADVQGLEGAERQRELLRLAREQGGELRLYTSLTSPLDRTVARAFQDRYGIRVSLYRADSEALAQRVSEEARAARRGTDVLETNGVEMAVLRKQGAFVPYRPPASARLVAGSVQDGWTATRFNRFVVSWNTDRVSRGEQPRSWQELADPRWKGRLALVEGDFDWYKTLREYWIDREGISEPQADRLFERIARNSRVVDSHAVESELLGAGEFSVAAANYSFLARNSIRKGAPVAYEPLVTPAFARPQGIALLKSAEHPAAAVLYVDWLLTDGQELLKRLEIDPARRDLAGQAQADVPVDVNAVAASAEEWSDRYDRLLRLGNAGG